MGQVATQLTLTTSAKPDVLAEVEDFIHSCKLKVVSKDFNRPWGGFFVLDELQAEPFCKLFFPGVVVATLQISGKLSPKILVVQPSKRLSWQYHNRRAEIWRLISGVGGIVRSQTDLEEDPSALQPGVFIRLPQGQRHRLVGLNGWGVIAEIWQHTIPDQPSDEDDIVRLQDDFGR